MPISQHDTQKVPACWPAHPNRVLTAEIKSNREESTVG